MSATMQSQALCRVCVCPTPQSSGLTAGRSTVPGAVRRPWECCGRGSMPKRMRRIARQGRAETRIFGADLILAMTEALAHAKAPPVSMPPLPRGRRVSGKPRCDGGNLGGSGRTVRLISDRVSPVSDRTSRNPQALRLRAANARLLGPWFAVPMGLPSPSEAALMGDDYL